MLSRSSKTASKHELSRRTSFQPNHALLSLCSAGRPSMFNLACVAFALGFVVLFVALSRRGSYLASSPG